MCQSVAWLDSAVPLQYGCLVVNAPTANTIAAAEHGIALLCALSRNVAQADASVKQVGASMALCGRADDISWPAQAEACFSICIHCIRHA